MLFPRLSSSDAESEGGSAVVDFLLVTFPLSAGCLVMLGIFMSWESLIAQAEQAFETARYSALADVTDAERNNYRDLNFANGTLVRMESAWFCSYQVSTTSQIDFLGLPEPIPVTFSREVSCEEDK